MTELLTYGDIRLLDIRDEAPADWDTRGATHVRVTLPAAAENLLAMETRGYLLADRTLGVSINLKRAALDFGRLVRMEIVETKDYREDILRIARLSFPEDRRFHILPRLDDHVAGLVLEEWVNALDECLVCVYKDQPVGFLALREDGPGAQFVHLAAVAEQYRAAGAALSLYGKAAALCKERGYRLLNGRVSARNTPVMNLYAALGGTFSAPEDVFLKEVWA